MPHNRGSAAAVLAPESADESLTFAVRSERDMASARARTLAAARALAAIASTAPPEQIARAADTLTKASGELWMHALRVAETRSN